MTLGDYINNFLNEHNMSMRSFAAQAGVSHTYVSYIVNGRTPRGTAPVPTIDKYKAFAKVMGVDVNQLIAAVDDEVAWPEPSEEDELLEELQMLRDMQERRALLHATKGMSADDVRRMAEFLEGMKKQSENNH